MRSKYILSALSFFLLFILTPLFVHAQNISWTGNGDGTSWDDAANWDPESVPAMGDEVIIDLSVNDEYTIEVTKNRTIASLSLDSRDAILSLGADLTVSSSYYQNFSTLTGGGDLTVNGELTFRNGTMSGNGTTFANGDSQFHSGTLDARRFVVASGQTLRRTDSFAGKNGAVLELEPNATFDHQSFYNMYVTSDSNTPPKILNFGLITGTLDDRVQIYWSVENHGTILAKAGNHLRLRGGIIDSGGTYRAGGEGARLDIWPPADVTFNDSSTLASNPGGRLYLGHSSDSDKPPELTISGTLNAEGTLKLGESSPPVKVVVTQNAIVQNLGGEALTVGDRASMSVKVDDPVTTGSLSLNFEGELSLSSDLTVEKSLILNNASSSFESDHATIVQGSINWQGGSILGSGTLTAEGGIELTGAAGSSSYVKQFDSHQIVVPNGTFAIYSGNYLSARNGATLLIEEGGVFDFQGFGNMEVMSGSSSPPAIINRGTLTKTDGGFDSKINWTVENHALVESENGRMHLQGAIADSNGVYRATDGGNIDFRVAQTETVFGTESLIEETGDDGQIRFERQSGNRDVPVVYRINGDYQVRGMTYIEGLGAVSSTRLHITDKADSLLIGNLFIDAKGEFRTDSDLSIVDGLNLNRSNSVFDNYGNVTVTGLMTWKGGNLSGSGSTVVDAGLQLPGTASNVKRLIGHQLVIAEEDTAEYTGTGLRARNGATLLIEEGGVFDFQGEGNLEVMSGSSSAPVIINRGTFTKTSGDFASEVGWTLENYGTLQSANHRFRFYGSITDQNGIYRATSGGHLLLRPELKAVTFKSGSVISSDTTGTISFGRQGGAEPSDTVVVYRINGTIDMEGTTRMAGAGEANVTVTPDATIEKLAGTALEMDHNSGVFHSEYPDSLTLGGIHMGRNNTLILASPLIVEGDVFQDESRIETTESIKIERDYMWAGGSLAGGDTLTANGGMQMTDSGVLDSMTVKIPDGLTAVINVRGWVSDRLYGRNGGTIEIMENARLEIRDGNDIDVSSESSAPPVIINRGTVTNTGGYNMVIRWTLENSGNVDVQSGRLRFAGPVKDNGGEYLTSGARLDLYSNSDIMLSDESSVYVDSDGEFSIDAEGDFRTEGDIIVDGGFYTETPIRSDSTITLNDPGTIIHGTPGRISNKPDSVIHLVNGGELSGDGFITGNVVSDSGIVRPGGKESTGVLNIQGDYLQRSGGTLDMELGGNSPGDGYDRLDAENIELDGTLRLGLINSYEPGENDILQPLRWSGSRTESFADVTYQNLGGAVLATEYGSNELRIFDGSLPEPPSAPNFTVQTSAPSFARTDRSIPVNVQITGSVPLAIGILETDNINFGSSPSPNTCPRNDAYENLKCRLAPFGIVPPEPEDGESYPFLAELTYGDLLSSANSNNKDVRDQKKSQISINESSTGDSEKKALLTTSRAAFIGNEGFSMGGSASCEGAGQNLQTSAELGGSIMTNESLDRCAAEAGSKIMDRIGSEITPLYDCYNLYQDLSEQYSSGFDNNNDMAAAMASNILGALSCAGDAVPATKAIKIMTELNSQIRNLDDFKTCFADGDGGGSGGAQTTCIASIDPNDKIGPGGMGVERYISQQDSLSYTVFFENKPEATAPAQTVQITDTLENDFDISTFTFGTIAFGDTAVATPNDTLSFEKDVDLRPERELILRIEGDADEETGVLKWTFTSLDPETGEPTTDPLAGFLPPNDDAPEGEGSVSYFADLEEDLSSGAKFGASARIIFDQNDPIDTPAWTNVLDIEPPQSEVNSLDATQDTVDFRVSWSGTDAESGIRSFSVYVSKNGSSYTPWIEDTTGTSAVFKGEQGSDYRFYSIARDSVGIVEEEPSSADASTMVSGNATSADPGNNEIPEQFTLEQNYPNPFNPTTNIRFGLPEEATVTLEVYNTIGQEVATLIENDKRQAGWYEVTLSASDFSSGIYIYRLQTGEFVESKKLTLIK